MTVTPLVHLDLVWCPECDAEMHPEAGFDIRDGIGYETTWVWWRCSEDPTHVSCAVPDPEQRRL